LSFFAAIVVILPKMMRKNTKNKARSQKNSRFIILKFIKVRNLVLFLSLTKKDYI